MYTAILYYNSILQITDYYSPQKKVTKVVYIYVRFFLRNYFYIINTTNSKNEQHQHQIMIINNLKKQLIISFFKNQNFFMSFSTGYCLAYFKMFKKSLKKATSSFSLQIKMVMGVLENCYIEDSYILNIKGTKKKFYKWLNIFKLKIKNLIVLYYIYTPKLSITKNKLKKIRSIKRRLRKKYTYQEDLT